MITHKNNIKSINKKYITNYNGDIYKLCINGIPDIFTTPDHPFYTRTINTQPKWIKSNSRSLIEVNGKVIHISSFK